MTVAAVEGVLALGDLPATSIGAGALLSLVVLMILTGKLVPKSTLDRETAEKDKWRDAWIIDREARLQQGEQLGQLLEYARTANRVIETAAGDRS